jgi:hypothetical protein
MALMGAALSMASQTSWAIGEGPIDTEDLLRNYRPPTIGGKIINIMNHPCGSRKARKARKGGAE